MRQNFTQNNKPGPVDRSSNPVRRPTAGQDVVVGEYYYGIDCPVCKLTSTLVKEANDFMVGARIDVLSVDPEVQYNKMVMDEFSRVENPNARSTVDVGGIEGTPSIIWADGLGSVGIPSKEGDFDEAQMREYIAVSAAKNYVKIVRPDFPEQKVHDFVVEEFFRNSHVAQGIDGDHKPYQALAEVTKRI